MAYETGTAAGHIDLLTKLRTFLTTNAELVAAGQEWDQISWQEVPDVAGQYELIVKGPGLAGDDEIYVGIRTYQSVASDYYNWYLNGYTGYDADLTWTTQPGYCSSPLPKIYLTNNSIKYWFVANGRRFVVVAKVSTVYQMCYMGFIIPYLPDTIIPYPLFIAGCGLNDLRWSDTTYGNNHGIVYPVSSQTRESDALLYSTATARIYDGEWKGIQNVYGTSYTGTAQRSMWPWCGPTTSKQALWYLRSNLDDSYTLFPIIPFQKVPDGTIYGELDGCYAVSGYSNSAENIIRVGGYDHLVVQNVFRTTVYFYWALKTIPTVTTTTTTTTSSSSTTTTTAP